MARRDTSLGTTQSTLRFSARDFSEEGPRETSPPRRTLPTTLDPTLEWLTTTTVAVLPGAITTSNLVGPYATRPHHLDRR